MARRRSDGGVEECKGYSPPNDHTTSASSTPLPLDSWDLNAGTRSTETESFRSARVARRRKIKFEHTAVGMNSTQPEIKTPCRTVVEFLKECKIRFCPNFQFLNTKYIYEEGI